MRFLEGLDIAAGVQLGDPEYRKQQKRQEYIQKQAEKFGKMTAAPPMPTIQKVPQCDGNASAFICAAFAILKILAITATTVTAIL